ncbi:hypothetical protein ANN_01790 [Periplaneta americana]|uniref:Uncharacterized protein n=1 Tax=Periplaneta americana TaxID=6978 RepID=A0ABQ8TUK7_PERAM|nr:hypothetical protein ANN_01790 [Periplaneta americana]
MMWNDDEMKNPRPDRDSNPGSLRDRTDRLDTATCTHTLLSTDVHIRTDHVRYTLRYLHCFSVVFCPHPSDSALNGILAVRYFVMKKRDAPYRVYTSDRSDFLYNRYNQLRNKTNQTIRNAKLKHFRNLSSPGSNSSRLCKNKRNVKN